jgi:hypothetical protein
MFHFSETLLIIFYEKTGNFTKKTGKQDQKYIFAPKINPRGIFIESG